MKTFHIHNENYYDEDQKLFESNSLKLKENTITCLTGCNGIGKTTVITQILQDNKTSLNKNAYNLNEDNTWGGGISKYLRGDTMKKEDYDCYYIYCDKRTKFGKTEESLLMQDLLGGFQSTGESNIYYMTPVFKAIQKEAPALKGKKLFVILDDLDVGVSVDVLVDIAEMLQRMEQMFKDIGVTYYIIITANSYELCRRFDCVDVVTFDHKKFPDYCSYVEYVCETRDYKIKREKENDERYEKRKKERQEQEDDSE